MHYCTPLYKSNSLLSEYLGRSPFLNSARNLGPCWRSPDAASGGENATLRPPGDRKTSGGQSIDIISLFDSD